MPDQTPYWLVLSRVNGIGQARFRRLLDYFGDAEIAWHAIYADLISAGINSRTAEAPVVSRRITDPSREMDRLISSGATALTWESENYPERLREVDDAPPVLYVLGSIEPQDSWSVAVVGTRRATHYGRAAASQLSAELAEGGVTIVSGLARGIDAIAHQAALHAGGVRSRHLPGRRPAPPSW